MLVALAHHVAINGWRFTAKEGIFLLGLFLGFVGCFAIEHRK